MRAQGKDKTQEREEFTWTDMSMISETRNETECCDTVKTIYIYIIYSKQCLICIIYILHVLLGNILITFQC